MKKTYAVSIIASRYTVTGEVKTENRVFIDEFHSKDEAIGFGYRKADEDFKQNDGWTRGVVALEMANRATSEVPAQWVEGKPTEPGYYWVSNGQTCHFIEVVNIRSELSCFSLGINNNTLLKYIHIVCYMRVEKPQLPV